MRKIKSIISHNRVQLLPILFIALGMLIVVSCHDDDDIDTSVPNRMFRPAAFTANPTAISTTLTWIPIGGAASYYMEVSKDSLEFATELQKISLEVSSSYILTDLATDTRYSVRIKTISGKPGVQDSDFKAITFVVPKN